MERFQQECAFLESIRHPNIVQYLGMTRDPESRLPVLLMELLDGSLTKMLERSQQSLAYYAQVDICYDIALAVAYLHSNDIIHRDLSSNNVLMIAERRAKVTDFGMSKLAGAAPNMTPLTMCPGTQAYMPPEALREPPRYTKKLDCFSEGVIMIQVCTRQWPEPGPRTQIIQDSRYPMGVVEVPVSETERRKNHIDLIDLNHTLLSIVIDCLQFQEMDRPSSEELCQRLAGLKESGEYIDSIQNHHDQIQARDNQIISQTQQLQEKDRLLQHTEAMNTSLTQQLQEKDRLLQQSVDEITTQNQQLQEKEGLLQDRATENASLTQQLQEKEGLLQDRATENASLTQQLQEKEGLLQDRATENASLTQQLREKEGLLQDRATENASLTQQLREKEGLLQDRATENASLTQQLREKEGLLQDRATENASLTQQLREKEGLLQDRATENASLTQQLREKEGLLQDRATENASLTQQLREKEGLLQDRATENASLTQQLREKEGLLQDRATENASLAQQLREKEGLLQDRATENASLTQQSLIQQLDDKNKAIFDINNKLLQQSSLLKTHQEEIASRERQLHLLNQLLEEHEKVTAVIQQTDHSLVRRMKRLQQQPLSHQSLKPPQPPPQAQVRGRQLQERESPKQLSLQVDHKPHSLTLRKIILNQGWKDGGKAPLEMSRGAAVVDGNVAYFMNWNGEACSYDSSSKRWRELPKCPCQCGSLVIIKDQLITIGGIDIYLECTNKLLISLRTRWIESKEVLPPMPTKRYSTTATTTKEHLIVAGGATRLTRADVVSTVEVMDTKMLVWSTVASLPHVYSYASGTICGDQLYMLGGEGIKGKTLLRESVLTCSLTELLQSSSSSSSIWHRVADAPVYYSTCAAVNGELLAVGGCDKYDKLTAAIHKYNPTTDSWDLISNMSTARHGSLVSVLPTNEMMVVGGNNGLFKNLSINKVEIANFY